MNEMKEYKFAKLYKISSGLSSTKDQAGHGAPFLSFSSVFNNFFLPDSLIDKMDTSAEEQKRYSIKAGDIFLTRTSETLDELAMSSVAIKDYPNATYSGFLKRLRPLQTNTTYAKFMAFYLRSSYFRKIIDNNATMTLRASFNEDMFSWLNLCLPDYEVQKKIGDFLYTIELKIKNNNHIINTLESMAKTLYDYWFVQFDFPDANGRPYKTSGGKMIWNEELGREIPEGWKVDNLLRIASYVNGLACQKYRPQNNEPALPVIKIREMHEGITKDTELVSSSIPDENKIDDGDILFSWSATLEIQYWTGGKGGLNQHIFKVYPNEGFPKEYVYHQLKESVISFVKIAEARKTTMGHITQDHLKFSRIAIPPVLLLSQFKEKIQAIHHQKILLSKENRRLVSLRDFLLPMLMNGQVGFK